jgi:ankyrin repeat protein
LAIVLVILFLVACLAAGGYWLMRRSKASSVTAGNTATATPAGTSAVVRETPKVEVALIKAIAEGRVDDAKQLLDKGADVNAADSDGTTALIQAAEGTAYLPNNGPTMAMLLEKGVNVDAQDKLGRTALYRATAEGKDEAVRLLIGHKANLNQKANDGSTAVMEAVIFGRVPALKLLLDSGADVNIADTQGTTPLMIASEGTAYMPNNAPLVIALLEKNARVDAQDSSGRTPLCRAAAEGKTDAARLLFDKKANPN